MKVLGIIPSRYASTRFPGKPLADLCGKTMIERVYEQCSAAGVLDHLVVATDDERIFQHVKGFGGECMMTRADHPNGTSRCNEVVSLLEKQEQYYDLVVNIQGDEPFIEAVQLEQLVELFDEPGTQITSLINKIKHADELWSPNVVKAVKKLNGDALYFSRHPIPFLRDVERDQWINREVFYKHLGLYAFRTDVLREISCLGASPLEMSEKLEQLCWLENGYQIKLGVTEYEGLGIDTPEDLAKLINNACE